MTRSNCGPSRRNTVRRERRISVFPYVEMHLTGGSTLMDFIAVLGGRYDAESRAVFGINSCVKFPPMFKAVLASDCPVAAATVSRDAFLGHYRDYRNPVAVERGDVHNPEAGTEWLGASLRHELVLEPGECRTVHCLLGVIDTRRVEAAGSSQQPGRRASGGVVRRAADARRMPGATGTSCRHRTSSSTAG